MSVHLRRSVIEAEAGYRPKPAMDHVYHDLEKAKPSSCTPKWNVLVQVIRAHLMDSQLHSINANCNPAAPPAYRARRLLMDLGNSQELGMRRVGSI